MERLLSETSVALPTRDINTRFALDDYTTNSHYLTYTFIGRIYFLNLEVKESTPKMTPAQAETSVNHKSLPKDYIYFQPKGHNNQSVLISLDVFLSGSGWSLRLHRCPAFQSTDGKIWISSCYFELGQGMFIASLNSVPSFATWTAQRKGQARPSLTHPFLPVHFGI